MRLPISWLKEFVDLPADLSVEALAERLTTAGLEVSKIHYLGLSQGNPRYGVPPSDHLVWDRERVIIGAIQEVKPHPKADRLVLAVVEYGAAEPETVVTGAPNLFHYSGQGLLNPPLLTAFALEGAELIDGHGDGKQRLILKEKELRGIPNRCMVCSEMELGLSDEHEGILLLDYTTFKDVVPGTPLADVLGDAILELELTPNLARCFSILGIAREVAALYNLTVHEPDYSLPPTSGEPVEAAIAIDIQEPTVNPRFTAALLRNIVIKPSPWWMQWRLKLVGQRPISNIVDVSNYVMFEVGQPTHAFDYDILAQRANGRPTIITRFPYAGEELTTLDGKNHKLEPTTLLVADTEGALGLAGVMGGLESEVQNPNPETGYPGTTTVLLEAAAWNFITIRKTMSSTKQHSEAAARFSRGVHPSVALKGLLRGIKLMCEVSGATLAPGIVDVYPNPPATVTVDFPLSEVYRLLGFHIEKAEVINLLTRLQFSVVNEDDLLKITVPDHRLDIDTGVIGKADIAEEIARIYGYNNIPNTIMDDVLPPQRNNPSLDDEEKVKNLLVEAGLQEVINYRFTTPEHEALLTPLGLPSSWGGYGYVRLLNPISAERTALRQTILGSLLDNAVTNMHHHPSIQIFEVGNVYYANPQGLPDEPRRLGILITGPRYVSWMSELSSAYVDFYDLKGILESLLDGLHIPARTISYTTTEHNTFHPGRVATLRIQDEPVGVLGQVHPLACDAFGLGLDLQKPILAAELDLDRVLAYATETFALQHIPLQPPVYRDIAVVVDESRTVAEIADLIWQSGGELLREVRLFDVYRGQPIPDSKKSLAYALTFQTNAETLNDKAVNRIQKDIVNHLEAHGAKLRA